jgi:hypothetical protein
MTRGAPIALGLVVLAMRPALAAPQGELRRLFPREADIHIDAGPSPLARLELSAEILASCKADLSDLRVFDGSGNEVAFLVDKGAAPPAAASLQQVVAARIVRADRSRSTPADAPVSTREVYELAVPTEPAPSGQWELLLQADAGRFIRRVDIAIVDGDKASAVVTGASLFRLPQANGERTSVALPARLGPLIRVTLTGQDEAYLEPRFLFRSAQELTERGQAVVPLVTAEQDRRDGNTIVELTRPSGIVPTLLRMGTTTPAFDRGVKVRDLGPGRDVPIGSATLFRVATLAPVEHLDVTLDPARGNRLIIEIEDGDSPALEQMQWSAVIRQPALVFSLPSNEGTLRFGGGRAHLPRYDLAGLIPADGEVVLGKRAQAAASLFSPGQLRVARSGPVRTNPAFDTAPALAFVMRAGAEIDRRLYSHERQLTVTPSADGLSRVRLEPGDLSRLRPDLADVRIADDQSRQWPYLVERDAEPAWLEVRAGRPDRRGRESRYALALPVAPLDFDRLSVVAAEPYFDRAYRVLGIDAAGNEVVLGQGRLVQGGTGPRSATLDLLTTPSRVQSARLIVEDGENAPLTLTSVRVRVPAPTLYLAAPSGSYSLLLGNPDDQAPAYDIARVRELVLAVASAPARAGPLAENPAFRRGARLATGQGPEHLLLWLVLGGGVVALGALTLRLARREGEPPPAAD